MMNLQGAHLTLLIGPTVPVPAPPGLLESLEQVKVTHDDERPSGFELTFKVGRSGPLDLIDYGLLLNPLLFQPLNRDRAAGHLRRGAAGADGRRHHPPATVARRRVPAPPR